MKEDVKEELRGLILQIDKIKESLLSYMATRCETCRHFDNKTRTCQTIVKGFVDEAELPSAIRVFANFSCTFHEF